MTDLLVQRLKAAKRELTALKTAHRRGLGMLKVYSAYKSDIPEVDLDQILVFTVTFDENFGPYPFFQLSTAEESISSNYFFSVPDAEYEDNGYAARVTLGFYQAVLAYYSGVYVVSSSPIISINCVVG